MFYIGFYGIYWDLDCDFIGFKSKVKCWFWSFDMLLRDFCPNDWVSFASKEFRFSNEFGILASKIGMILRFR